MPVIPCKQCSLVELRYKPGVLATERDDIFSFKNDSRDPILEIPNFETICEEIQSGWQSRDSTTVIPSVNSLKILIMKGVYFDQDQFISSLFPVLRELANVKEQPDMVAEVMQLFQVIQCCTLPISSLFLSKEFMEFCWLTARGSNPIVAVHALQCISNIAGTSLEWRDMVMESLPVEFLEADVIQKDTVHREVRKSVLEIVLKYSRFPLSRDYGVAIVRLCKNCFESNCEVFYDICLNALLSLLKNCPEVVDLVKSDPIREQVDTICHGVEREQLLPALELMNFYFSSGMADLCARSLFNLVTLLGHEDVDVSTSSYKALKVLMAQNEKIIESVSMADLMDTFNPVIHRSPSVVKARVGKFFCSIVRRSEIFAKNLVLSNNLDIFLELLQFEDLVDLQMNVIMLLRRILERFDGPSGIVCEQLHRQGIEELFSSLDGTWGTEELETMAHDFFEIYMRSISSLTERGIPEETPPLVVPPKRKRTKRVVLFHRRAKSEEEEENIEEPTPPKRMRLWVK